MPNFINIGLVFSRNRNERTNEPTNQQTGVTTISPGERNTIHTQAGRHCFIFFGLT